MKRKSCFPVLLLFSLFVVTPALAETVVGTAIVVPLKFKPIKSLVVNSYPSGFGPFTGTVDRLELCNFKVNTTDCRQYVGNKALGIGHSIEVLYPFYVTHMSLTIPASFQVVFKDRKWGPNAPGDLAQVPIGYRNVVFNEYDIAFASMRDRHLRRL